MKKIWLLLFICTLCLSACKKQKTLTELLAGTEYKEWKRYQYKQGNGALHLLNDCFDDDVWRFYNNGTLEINLSSTNCGGFPSGTSVVIASWSFNSAEDTLSWTYQSNSETSAFRLETINESELVVYQRVDSAGNTNTPQSTIDMRNYFMKL